jgi:hypothetical protein
MKNALLLIFIGAFIIIGCEDEIINNPEVDREPPRVELTSPVDGSLVGISTLVEIIADASDNVAVSKVDFYIDGAFLSSDSDSPYEAFWSVSKLTPLGPHTIFARAFDRAGNNTKSDEITVNVREIGPR